MISMIAAIDNKGAIGKNDKLPWHLPNDLAYFKDITCNNTIVMGRRTFDSLPFVLPKRKHIVLTNDRSIEFPENVFPCYNHAHLLDEYKYEELFVIGGSIIFSLFLPYAERIYLTKIDHDFNGDTFFPQLNWNKWEKTYHEEGVIDEKNIYVHDFYVYDRIEKE